MTIQRRSHGAASSCACEAQNGSGDCTSSLPQARSPQRYHRGNNGDINSRTPTKRLKKKKRTKKEIMHEVHLDSELETNFQLCLMTTLMLMTGFYALWKLSGGGAPIPHVRLFGQRKIYNIPGSMEKIGDKSDGYILLRKEIDEVYNKDSDRSLKAVQALHKRTYKVIPIPSENEVLFYDIYNCPNEPPHGYPYAWPILDVLNNWPPDDPTPQLNGIHQGLCVFDYKDDYDKALTYRTMELPFIVRGDPEVAASVERWNSPGYMDKLMGAVLHRTEYSGNNHFMYWMKPNLSPDEAKIRREAEAKANKRKHHFGGYRVEKPANWSQPTQMMRMNYEEWVSHANVSDDQLGPDKPHWYYRLIGCGSMGDGKCDKGSSEYLFDELTFFQPKKGLYLSEPDKQKGIHCRFGMKGVIAENHFDGSRNAIVVLGGERRYILSHPDQCELLSLFPKDHPSARHSAVDWSDPDLESFPDFHKAVTNEVVLQAGDVLYLPTNWFHYIISLDLNFQCNTRSGLSSDYMPPIHSCGF